MSEWSQLDTGNDPGVEGELQGYAARGALSPDDVWAIPTYFTSCKDWRHSDLSCFLKEIIMPIRELLWFLS